MIQRKKKHAEEEEGEKITETAPNETVLKAFGLNAEDTPFKEVKHNPALISSWGKWSKQGLPEEKKKEILEQYDRKGELYCEAPKINLELTPLLTEIAKKRDDHFLHTQNCVGTALSSLGAAISMMIDPPEEGIREEVFTDLLSHTGQILADIFHQQRVARRSFITPLFNKSIKSTVDSLGSDEWLYSAALRDKVKDAKDMEKICSEIKEKPKAPLKKPNQGKSRYPPATHRQAGQQQKPRYMRFGKPAPPPARAATRSQTKPQRRTSSRSSPRK
ncbi:uncharacterized protein LOC135161490 [Diachasmimorpha longicaudata]|uniref:uncharacterized protein LOC135161490 n=1 Tax=Diachasmimorpha longicaudata TaxID=58733 RepID=UPI0030B875DE